MSKIKKISQDSGDQTKHSSGAEHDTLFSQALSNVRIAQDFMRQHLPQPLQEVMDLNTLALCKDIFIQTDSTKRVTDMLYRCRFKDSQEEAYFLTLVEHQSTPAKNMPLRILEYETSIMVQHLRNHRRVPLVYGMVYYTGTRRWKYSTDIKDLIAAPRELIEKYALKPFHLVQLNQIDDAVLREHLWSGLLSMVFKHVLDRDILPILRTILEPMKAVEQENGGDFVQALLNYLYEKANIQDEEEFRSLIIKNLSEETIGGTMSLAQRHIEIGLQKGLQLGRQEGRQEGERITFLRLLKRRFGLDILPARYQTRIEAANDEELLNWIDRVLDAKTLEDVFAE